MFTRVLERLNECTDPALVRRLLTSAFVLCRLRLDRERLRTLIQGARVMNEAGILEEIVGEERAEGMHRALLRLGRKKFGEPEEASRTARVSITDLDRLDRLSEFLLDVGSWQELLETP